MSSDASNTSGTSTGPATSVDTATTASVGTTITYNSAEREKELINADYTEDVQVFGDKWSCTWLDGMASVAVYTAIAGPAGKEESLKLYDQLEWSEIPRDFILDSDKWSVEKLRVRLVEYGHVVFNKLPKDKTTKKLDAKCIDGDLAKDFEKRCYSLREMIIGLAKPRSRSVWAARFNARYPNYTYSGGKKVTCPDDFIEAILNEPYDNKMRGMIFYIQVILWGKGNSYALQIESKIMQLCKLKYMDDYCDLEKENWPKKKHQGGCIKTMLVRLKQSSFVNKFRRVVREQQNERLYHRNVGTSKEIKAVQRVTVTSHGFNGWLGLCEGHPDLEKVLKQQKKAEAPVMKQTDMRTWFNEVMAEGEVTSRAQLLEALQKMDKPGMVEVTDGPSEVSPLNDDSSAFTTVCKSPDSVRASPIMEIQTVQAGQLATKKPVDKATTKTRAKPTTKTSTVKPKTSAAKPKKKSIAKKKPTAKPKKKPSVSNASAETPIKARKMFDKDFVASLEVDSSDDESRRAPVKVSPRKKRSGGQIEKDLIKKPPIICCHTSKNPLLGGWETLEPAYFTATHLEKQRKKKIAYPFLCGGCTKPFLSGRSVPEGTYKVTTSTTVRCCPNAAKPDHECNFGMCTCCFGKLVLEAEKEQQKQKEDDGGNSKRSSSRESVKEKSAKRAKVGAHKGK